MLEAMSRTDYYHDPDAPKANSLVPSTTAAVRDDAGRLLLIHKIDNDFWALPGGAMEIGESIADAAVREVAEETGMTVEVTGLVGIYTDPGHVMAYDDGEVRQEFSICVLARVRGGSIEVSDESTEVQAFAPEEIPDLPMVPSIRLRVSDYLAGGAPAIR
jgi:ADP-ribose pyrophosphatase YjhB (NUDIX family)